MDADLKALGRSLARRVRAETPGAGILVRMAQDLALTVWMKVQMDGGNLMTLNRALSELNRSLRVLGVRLPGGIDGRGRSRRRQRGRDIFRPPRPEPVEDDDGEHDGEPGVDVDEVGEQGRTTAPRDAAIGDDDESRAGDRDGKAGSGGPQSFRS